MSRLLAIWALLMALVVGIAQAQFFTTMTGSAGAPTSYTGPGDVVSSASAWYGMRAYNAAYATGSNNSATLRRASDNTTQSFVILSNGKVDTASIATFCNATSCFGTTWNDQTGNGNNVTQATAADQPTYTASCINSLPCFTFDGSATFLASGTTSFTTTTPLSTSKVVEYTGTHSNFDSLLSWFSGSTGEVEQASSGTANSFCAYAGSRACQTTSDNAAHALQTVYNSTNSAMMIDGTDHSPFDTGTGNTGKTVLHIGSDVSGGGGGHWKGPVAEIGAWNNVAFTGTQRSNLHSNQSSYWGTP